MSQQISGKLPPQLQVLQNPMDMATLNMQQLTLFKQHLDQELGVLQDSLHTLKIAQSRFQESGVCLEKITPAAQGESYFHFLKLASTSD